MLYFEFQSPHKRKYVVIVCMFLTIVTLPNSECLGISPPKSSKSNEIPELSQKNTINLKAVLQKSIEYSEMSINRSKQGSDTF